MNTTTQFASYRFSETRDTIEQNTATLNRLVDLSLIDQELDKIEREYRLSFIFVGMIGLCLFGVLFATL
jgi:hypothetical protein